MHHTTKIVLATGTQTNVSIQIAKVGQVRDISSMVIDMKVEMMIDRVFLEGRILTILSKVTTATNQMVTGLVTTIITIITATLIATIVMFTLRKTGAGQLQLPRPAVPCQ